MTEVYRFLPWRLGALKGSGSSVIFEYIPLIEEETSDG